MKHYKLYLLLVLLLPMACKKAENPGPNEVFMQNKSFIPAQLTVKVGTTVTWTNKEAVLHTVTSDQIGLFDSGRKDKDETFQFNFPTAGVYYYHSNTDNGMTGAVIVQ